MQVQNLSDICAIILKQDWSLRGKMEILHEKKDNLCLQKQLISRMGFCFLFY